MQIGVLTGGGDCPGLNAVIRAIARKGIDFLGHTFVGFRDGWLGVVEDDAVDLTIEGTRGILPRGGTILGSSGTNPYRLERGPERVREILEKRGIDGLVVIGGEGTLSAAARLSAEGVAIVGVPKTIQRGLLPYRKLFGRAEGFEHVSRYVTGLILSGNKTLQGIYDSQVWEGDKPSRRAMHEAVFEAGWAAEGLLSRHRAVIAPEHQGHGREVISAIRMGSV